MRKLVGCSALLVLVCSASVCSADLVAHWSFDETDGTTAAESVGGHDAMLMGNAAFAPSEGQFGGALDLRQNAFRQADRTDWAEFAWDEVFDTETFTISIWFNMAEALNPSGDPGIHFGLHGNRANIGNSGWGAEVSGYNGLQNLRAWKAGGTNDVTTEWNATVGEWAMATWVIDGAAREARVYANGELTRVNQDGRNQGPFVDFLSLGGSAPLFPQGDSGFRIGDTGGGSSGERFIGMLDDMGIWNHALSPEEVADVYANGIPEPGTLLMLLSGGLGLLLWAVRRRT